MADKDKEKEVIVTAVGSIDGSTSQSGTITSRATYTGSLNTSLEENGAINANISVENDLNGFVNLVGDVNGKSVTNGATSGQLTLRVGQDGIDGKDGFSPIITVHKDTKTEYVLKVTNKDGSYLTPNLYPDLEGLQDIETLVAGKVDEDLAEYPAMDATRLTEPQKEGSFLYVRTYNGLNRKIPMSQVALEPETSKKIASKIRTTTTVPKANEWRIGDYILLDDDGNKPVEGE